VGPPVLAATVGDEEVRRGSFIAAHVGLTWVSCDGGSAVR
jgi:hypothetical protein